MALSADHTGFYCGQERFHPIVQTANECIPEANAVLVTLPADLREDLNWSPHIQSAEKAAATQQLILWEIDLGLSSRAFSPHDSAAFFTYSLAIEEFTMTVWPQFKHCSLGAVLYRGSLSFEGQFPLAVWESAFSDWRKDGSPLVSENNHGYALFCVQAFSEYLHRLVSFLPDELPAFAMLDVAAIGSAATEALLFSKERFEHLHLILKGAKTPVAKLMWEENRCLEAQTECPALGLYLPQDACITLDILGELDLLIEKLKTAGLNYRIIPEEKLTEHWNGLDTLIVPARAVGLQGKRKLLGFAAAGGTVAVHQGTLDIPGEVTFLV